MRHWAAYPLRTGDQTADPLLNPITDGERHVQNLEYEQQRAAATPRSVIMIATETLTERERLGWRAQSRSDLSRPLVRAIDPRRRYHCLRKLMLAEPPCNPLPKRTKPESAAEYPLPKSQFTLGSTSPRTLPSSVGEIGDAMAVEAELPSAMTLL